MSLPKTESLILKLEDSVLVASIHRPEAMNALNFSVLKDLNALVGWLSDREASAEVRAVILTGAGEKAFVAGADIKEFETMNADGATQFAMSGQKLFTALSELKVPVLAAVNGFALGGGLELALACDFIYASKNAKFGLPECTLGLMPGYGGTVRLPRRIGVGRAREMTLTGAMITADEAFRIGLVNKVTSQAELLGASLETAKMISQRAPLAVARIKKSIHEGASLAEPEADRLEARLFGELFSTADKSEGVRAFIEKRKPVFTGQ